MRERAEQDEEISEQEPWLQLSEHSLMKTWSIPHDDIFNDLIVCPNQNPRNFLAFEDACIIPISPEPDLSRHVKTRK